MLKMYYFSNKFSKIAKCWGSSPPSPFNLQYWWPEIWPNCGFSSCYDVISV